MPCEDDTPFKLKPIKFWSYERWNGVATPCANEGYNHSVTLGAWRMRRVKDVFDDFYLAGRRTLCSACKAHKAELQDERKALAEELEQEVGEEAAAEAISGGAAAGELEEEQQALLSRLTVLDKEIKSFHYTSTTLNPMVNKFVFERYPGIAVAFPAILTHRAGISMEALMMISRAARTAQSSRDLEQMFLEFKTLRNARARLSYYNLQYLAGVHRPPFLDPPSSRFGPPFLDPR